MASYAAVLSLMNTLNLVNKHPSPPISLHQSQVESLTQNLTFFQHFLECYSGEEDEDLESRIAAAAYAAEDVIESHIVDHIHGGSNICSVDLSQQLQRVIQDMDLIKNEVMKIIQVKIITPQHHHYHLHTNSSGGSASTWQSSAMPVFDDDMVNEVLDKLTGQQSGLQIIPIVGMGGIGILRPMDDKSLEEVAVEYLKELMERNLILISELRWDGKARLYKVHDLLRDVCLREAQKQKLFCVVRQKKHHTPQGIDMERRICIHPENAQEKYSPEFFHAVESASLTRSLFYTVHACSDIGDASPSLRFRLLRIYSPVKSFERFVPEYNNSIFEQANLRYFFLEYHLSEAAVPRLLSLFSLLWNLQTLKVRCSYFSKLTFEIWKMPLLRHVILDGFALPDPSNGEDNFVLENLQTLSGIINFRFSEEVVKRIPNIKKLKLICTSPTYNEGVLPDFCLNNLGRLQKLESLNLMVAVSNHHNVEIFRRNVVSFPQSLQKLTLHGTQLSWEEFAIKIGSLPLLQVLRLTWNACRGPKWETVEGQFSRLRVLRIAGCWDLKYWETDSTHFPCLEHLILRYLDLEEIPSNIGDIPTLKSIRLESCNEFAVDSALRLKEEQADNGNEDIQVIINY